MLSIFCEAFRKMGFKEESSVALAEDFLKSNDSAMGYSPSSPAFETREVPYSCGADCCGIEYEEIRTGPNSWVMLDRTILEAAEVQYLDLLEKKKKIMITRHGALVEYAREIGLIDEETEIIPHCADPEQIRGKTVIGPLPLHLAAEAEAIINIPLKLDPADRGRELSLEEVRQKADKPQKYRITKVD